MGIILHHTCSEAETPNIAENLVGSLSLPALVLLQGELGAGKTVFVKGMARGLGIDPEEVRSPTFALIHEYLQGKIPLYHMDFYRLDEWEDVVNLGFEEYLDREGVVVVEWGDKFLSFLTPPFWVVEIQVVALEERNIILKWWVQ
ncbi:MAG: tRNA (adenosine(37)-N6)-threonylcarbamoyltransferase complex ATPase subunit type 1 TsaE [Atribacterota bacterium]|nr:tRNA (adenosine(37)-N6)-threonylcarbamoyltransferase complex ATPase subunit type 1 TsaE [Atribacterota bacterium]